MSPIRAGSKAKSRGGSQRTRRESTIASVWMTSGMIGRS